MKILNHVRFPNMTNEGGSATTTTTKNNKNNFLPNCKCAVAKQSDDDDFNRVDNVRDDVRHYQINNSTICL